MEVIYRFDKIQGKVFNLQRKEDGHSQNIIRYSSLPNHLDSSDLLRCRETINFLYSTLEDGQSLQKQIQAKHENLYTGLNVLKPRGENCKQYLKQLTSLLEPTVKEISEKLKLVENTFALIKQKIGSKDAEKKEESRKEI